MTQKQIDKEIKKYATGNFDMKPYRLMYELAKKINNDRHKKTFPRI